MGYQLFLFIFARRKIKTLRRDVKEAGFFAFMNAIEKEGDLLDIGANIGIMSVHLSRQFSDRHILAIEPMPSNLTVLMRVIKHYQVRNVEVVATAVGDQDGEEVEMILPLNGKVKMQGLAHVVHESIPGWNKGERFSISSDTIDTIVGDRKIAGIKMDIENYEYFALVGAKKVLNRDKPVLYLELWDNENRTNCINLLKNMDYGVYVNTAEGLEEYDSRKHQTQNFIFK